MGICVLRCNHEFLNIAFEANMKQHKDICMRICMHHHCKHEQLWSHDSAQAFKEPPFSPVCAKVTHLRAKRPMCSGICAKVTHLRAKRPMCSYICAKVIHLRAKMTSVLIFLRKTVVSFLADHARGLAPLTRVEHCRNTCVHEFCYPTIKAHCYAMNQSTFIHSFFVNVYSG